MPKTAVGKFSLRELQIGKGKFFTQSPTKFFPLTLEVAYQVAEILDHSNLAACKKRVYPK